MTIAETFAKDVGSDLTDTLIVFGLLFALQILMKIWSFMKVCWRHNVRPCFQKRGRLYDTYGSKKKLSGNPNVSVQSEKQLDSQGGDATWAVVTGGSDGIGLAIAKELANEGFHICIVSRTESKINDKLEEIRKECRMNDSTFKTLAVVADFTTLHTIADYQTTIGDKLKDLDVGVLILNAGYVYNGPYMMLYPNEIERHMTTNMLHVAYTTKVMIEQLDQRFDKTGKKSAIVVVSSIMASLPMSGLISYCSSKIWATYFGMGLGPEHKGRIDVMAYEPGGVATKLLGTDKTDAVTISTKAAADVCFRDIGISNHTRGVWVHYFICWLMNLPPLQSTQDSAYKGCKEHCIKERAKEAEQKKDIA